MSWVERSRYVTLYKQGFSRRRQVDSYLKSKIRVCTIYTRVLCSQVLMACGRTPNCDKRTCQEYLDGTALDDNYSSIKRDLAIFPPTLFGSLDDFHPRNDFAKNDMFPTAISPCRDYSLQSTRDKRLTRANHTFPPS